MQEEFPVPWDQANLACRYLYICRYLACKFELLKCCVCSYYCCGDIYICEHFVYRRQIFCCSACRSFACVRKLGNFCINAFNLHNYVWC